MSIKESKFIEFSKNLFEKYNSDYEKINTKLQEVFKENPKEKNKLAHYTHFYYFICTPESDTAREELQIVGMTSLMEAMMGEVKFKDVFTYFESEFPKQNRIDNFKKFKEGYLNKFGATRKVVQYFKNFIPQEETKNILKNIKVWDEKEGDLDTFNNIEQLARFFYQMRSDFVHTAEMRYFCPTDCFASLLSIGGEQYDVRVTMPEIIKIFEKSYVKYWEEKYKKLI